MASVERQVESLERWCAKRELSTRYHRAQTGTYYLSVEMPNGGTAKVRIADHADAYATADYSIDLAEGTLTGAKAFLETVIAGEVSLAKLHRAVRKAQSDQARRYEAHQEDVHGGNARRMAEAMGVEGARRAAAILCSRPSRRNNGQGNQNWRGELAALVGKHRDTFRNVEFVKRLHRAVAKRM